MDIATLLIQLLSGAAGGNVAGGMMKNLSLGTFGNSLAGLIGGGLGTQILGSMLGPATTAATTMSAGPDIGDFIGQVLGGGAGGGVMMMLIGLLKQMFQK